MLRRLDTPSLPVAPSSVDTARTPERTNTVAPSRTSPATVSTFTPGSAGAAPAPIAAGPVDLSSLKGQQAVEASLSFLGVGNTGFTGRSIVHANPPLAASSVEQDELGMTHVRLDRMQDGLKVFGEQVITHLDQDGKVESVTGGVEPLKFAAGAQNAPKLSEQDAIAHATADFKKDNPGVDPKNQPKAELLYYTDDNGQTHKAYQVQLANFTDGAKPMNMNYMVDAQSGKVLTKYNTIDTIQLPKKTDTSASSKPTSGGGTGTPTPTPAPTGKPGTGSSIYDGSVNIETKKNADGSFSLEDDTRGGGKTMDANNTRIDSSGNWDHSKATDFKDKNNVWGEVTDSTREKAAVDAHYGMEMTWDFYKNVLGRSSIDGKGMALNSYVHLDNKYDNAFWDGKAMQYGDGDGTQFGSLTTIDITGHEISHGLTEKTASLVYEGQSGGLNEAWSDIMGKGVQWYASQQNPAVKFDWGVGTQAFNPGHNDGSQALRYMNDPTKDGGSIDNVKNYKGSLDVHYSSGVANNAFYLTVEGGKNRTSGKTVDKGIGMQDALKIYYRAEAFYMTPKSTFKDAANACVKAATDLYGANSAQVKAVTQAWQAVGAIS